MQIIDSNFHVIYLPEVDSTSGYLKRKISEGLLVENTLCLTENQTQGYGQRGRSWLRAKHGLALSYAVLLNEPIRSSMSAEVALLLHEYLTANCNDTIQLKWPNDLFNASGKVAGILLEVQRNPVTKRYFMVIGIGLNLLSAPKLEEGDYPVSALNSLDKQSFITHFSGALYQHFSLGYCEMPFSQAYWSRHDYFQPNQPVIVYDTDQIIEAQYIGVNEKAELQLKINNALVCYQSSRVSVRANKG